MTRKPNRSVAIAGAALPAPDPEEVVGVEVMESVVELELGEIDDDDMMDPRNKMPPVEILPTQGWMRVMVVRTEYRVEPPHIIRKSYS